MVIQAAESWDTHPHNPKRKPLPSRKPLIHEYDGRRVRDTRAKAVENTLGDDQLRCGRGQRAERQGQGHCHKTRWCGPDA